jgi:hypothetical protein
MLADAFPTLAFCWIAVALNCVGMDPVCFKPTVGVDPAIPEVIVGSLVVGGHRESRDAAEVVATVLLRLDLAIGSVGDEMSELVEADEAVGPFSCEFAG